MHNNIKCSFRRSIITIDSKVYINTKRQALDFVSSVRFMGSRQQERFLLDLVFSVRYMGSRLKLIMKRYAPTSNCLCFYHLWLLLPISGQRWQTQEEEKVFQHVGESGCSQKSEGSAKKKWVPPPERRKKESWKLPTKSIAMTRASSQALLKTIAMQDKTVKTAEMQDQSKESV